MGPHQGSVEGEENLPRPAGHSPPNASQDPVSFLGSQGTLLAHGQPVIHQDTQVAFHRAALQQVRLKPVLMHRTHSRADSFTSLFLVQCREVLWLPWIMQAGRGLVPALWGYQVPAPLWISALHRTELFRNAAFLLSVLLEAAATVRLGQEAELTPCREKSEIWGCERAPEFEVKWTWEWW